MALASILSGNTVAGQGRTGRGGAGRGFAMYLISTVRKPPGTPVGAVAHHQRHALSVSPGGRQGEARKRRDNGQFQYKPAPVHIGPRSDLTASFSTAAGAKQLGDGRLHAPCFLLVAFGSEL